jgi:DNA-directed RNA polymerase subunit beta
MSLEFVSYTVGTPKQDVVDCIKDGNTFNAPLHSTSAEEQGRRPQREGLSGRHPMMTERGTFVITAPSA